MYLKKVLETVDDGDRYTVGRGKVGRCRRDHTSQGRRAVQGQRIPLGCVLPRQQKLNSDASNLVKSFLLSSSSTLRRQDFHDLCDLCDLCD